LSERQENFCQRWVLHQNATTAFVECYPHAKKWKRTSARRGAYRPMKRNDIIERIGELMKRALAAHDARFDAYLRKEDGLEDAIEVVVSDADVNGMPTSRQ
jgi:hypothetical protein